MGRNDAVLRGQKRIVLPDRLRGHHVHRRARDLAGVEGVRQICLHNELPPGGVDEQHAVAHFGNAAAADDAGVFRAQAAMEGDHVGARQKLVKADVFGELPSLLRGMRAARQNVHAQCPGNASGGLADASEAEDAHGLARQLCERVVPEAEIGVFRPLPRVYRVGVVPDAVAELQKQGNGELADRRGAVGRHVGNGDAELPRAGGVYYIISRRQDADILQIGAGRQHRAG